MISQWFVTSRMPRPMVGPTAAIIAAAERRSCHGCNCSCIAHGIGRGKDAEAEIQGAPAERRLTKWLSQAVTPATTRD
jgi:hypothetical protein